MAVQIARAVGTVFLLLFVSACSSTSNMPTSYTADMNDGIIYDTKLSKAEQAAHYETIMFAVQTLGPNEEMSWTEEYATGKVKVLVFYPTSSGFCKHLKVVIKKNNTTRELRETACTDFDGKFWQFLG